MRRRDPRKVLVLGPGPGSSGRPDGLDDAVAQACRALRALGIEVVVLDGRPAAVATEPELADRTYVEPPLAEIAERILARERPDALLPTHGGRSALALAAALGRAGALERHGVEPIGAPLEAIEAALDRERFAAAMRRVGLALPRGGPAGGEDEAAAIAEQLGYPVVVRPASGARPRLVHDSRQLREAARGALAAGPGASLRVEESLLGWKEFELQVVRDRADNAVVVCSIESLDPAGVHTRDRIAVIPAPTLADREQQRLRDAAFRAMRGTGLAAGAASVQLAVHPDTGDTRVVAIQPCLARAAALAAKATGYPIARVAAMLAAGLTLDEIPRELTGAVPACVEPALDRCVVAIPAAPLDEPRADARRPGARPAATGGAMAIGRTFPEALLKALRALATGADRLPGPAAPGRFESSRPSLGDHHAERLVDLFRDLAAGASVETLSQLTGIDPWFLHQMERIVALDRALAESARHDRATLWNGGLVREAKRLGFSDAHLAARLDLAEADVRRLRLAHGIRATIQAVDGGGLAPAPSCWYATYEEEDEAPPAAARRVVLLGGGAHRAGQGPEFDACCRAAALELRSRGFEVVLIDSHPGAAGADPDGSTRLHVAALCVEDVLDVVEAERAEAVIVQFGGPGAMRLAPSLADAGVPLWGGASEVVARVADRDAFRALLESQGLHAAAEAEVVSTAEALAQAAALGYPVRVRRRGGPGGSVPRLAASPADLEAWLAGEGVLTPDAPALLQALPEGAIEVGVDALADGESVLVAAVLEPIGEGGPAGGEPTWVIPPFSLGERSLARVREATRRVARALGARGPIHLRCAVHDEKVVVLEADPCAARTVPFASKAVGLPLARLAARVLAGERLAALAPAEPPEAPFVSVRKPVLPWGRWAGRDGLPGPDPTSTGEVMGRDLDFGRALAKAHLGSGEPLPAGGTVLLSVRDDDKRAITFMAQKLVEMGYDLVATRGTARFLARNGVACREAFKVREGRPHVVDLIENGEIHLVLNTPLGRASEHDEKAIRDRAAARGVPVITTVAGALAAVAGMEALRRGTLGLAALQEAT